MILITGKKPHLPETRKYAQAFCNIIKNINQARCAVHKYTRKKCDTMEKPTFQIYLDLINLI